MKSAHPSLLPFGLWIYILSDCVLFASFFAAYAVLHTEVASGPAASALFDTRYVLLETIALLASSFACGMAVIAARRGSRGGMWSGLLATFLLGGAFLGMEVHEFAGLIEIGAGPSASAFLSSFFTLVGTHGLHVAAGLLWLSVLAIALARHGVTERNQARLYAFSLFWHFLDIIWICIFSLVYLFGSLSL